MSEIKGLAIKVPTTFTDSLGEVTMANGDGSQPALEYIATEVPNGLKSASLDITGINIQDSCWDGNDIIILGSSSTSSGNQMVLYRYTPETGVATTLYKDAINVIDPYNNNSKPVNEVEGIVKLENASSYLTNADNKAEVEGKSVFLITGASNEYFYVFITAIIDGDNVTIKEPKMIRRWGQGNPAGGYWQDSPDTTYRTLQSCDIYGDKFYQFYVGGKYFGANLSAIVPVLFGETENTSTLNIARSPISTLTCAKLDATAGDKWKYLHFGSAKFCKQTKSGSTIPLLFAGHDQNFYEDNITPMPRNYVIDVEHNEIVCAYIGVKDAWAMSYDFDNDLVYALYPNTSRTILYCKKWKLNKKPI